MDRAEPASFTSTSNRRPITPAVRAAARPRRCGSGFHFAPLSASALSACYTHGMIRPRFTLRMLLAIVAVCAMPIAWVSYSLRWIDQRQRFRVEHSSFDVLQMPFIEPPPSAPGLLWLFGEYSEYGLNGTILSAEELAEAQSLFPEAKTFYYPGNGKSKSPRPSH